MEKGNPQSEEQVERFLMEEASLLEKSEPSEEKLCMIIKEKQIKAEEGLLEV